jgi:ribonuclease HII
MACTLRIEKRLWASGARLVAGVDEAGCGCLAGPVVAAVVMVQRVFRHPRVDDSKRLSPEQRAELYTELRADTRLVIATGSASVEEIDRLNILRASHLAMERAIRALPTLPDGLLIDGRPVRPFPFAHQAVVRGDGLCFSIAAASIIAKVERDRMMEQADSQFPGYGFARHKGYGTSAHQQALMALGVTPLHRLSFAPVAQVARGEVVNWALSGVADDEPGESGA